VKRSNAKRRGKQTNRLTAVKRGGQAKHEQTGRNMILFPLDERAADAMRVIIDTAGRVDRRRAMRLIEACATLITFAPRHVRSQTRRKVR
jgi:hypothetical protein